MKNLREKYINTILNYIYFEYFHKLFLERADIKIFGKLNLLRKQRIYELMIMNELVDSSMEFEFQPSIQEKQFIFSGAKAEYKDLLKQIQKLEKEIGTVDERYMNEPEELYERNIDKLREIIRKASPLLNKNKKAVSIWKDFFDVLKKPNDEEIGRIYQEAKKIRLYSISDQNEEEIKKEMLRVLKAKKEKREKHPYNFDSILTLEKQFGKRVEEIQTDIKKLEGHIEHLNNMYLNINHSGQYNN
ncbi:MAG: hypothetical protein Q4A42_01090 [Tissierellia bacterium]|nr:hypothetical protein [Tissierellia bacterium]